MAKNQKGRNRTKSKQSQPATTTEPAEPEGEEEGKEEGFQQRQPQDKVQPQAQPQETQAQPQEPQEEQEEQDQVVQEDEKLEPSTSPTSPTSSSSSSSPSARVPLSSFSPSLTSPLQQQQQQIFPDFLVPLVGPMGSLVSLVRSTWIVKRLVSLISLVLSILVRSPSVKFLVKSLLMASWFFFTCLYGLLCSVVDPVDRKNLNFRVGRFYSLVAPYLGISQTVEGEEHLDNLPCVFVVNHQSFLDLISVGIIMPKHTALVAKKSLRYIPVLGWFLQVANNILIDRENPEQARKSMEKAGRELCERKVPFFSFFSFFFFLLSFFL
jgi:1-acyl-sn-glycerol-3-phosphate acyltransferase